MLFGWSGSVTAPETISATKNFDRISADNTYVHTVSEEKTRCRATRSKMVRRDLFSAYLGLLHLSQDAGSQVIRDPRDHHRSEIPSMARLEVAALSRRHPESLVLES